MTIRHFGQSRLNLRTSTSGHLPAYHIAGDDGHEDGDGSGSDGDDDDEYSDIADDGGTDNDDDDDDETMEDDSDSDCEGARQSDSDDEVILLQQKRESAALDSGAFPIHIDGVDLRHEIQGKQTIQRSQNNRSLRVSKRKGSRRIFHGKKVDRDTHLVIVHDHSDTSCLPSNTNAWLCNRPRLFSHHHVRAGVMGDHRRMARFLAGESIGIVLGGGGSRGLAHLGALQALEQEGIPIDCVGGTSQGSFMGALYASTLSSTTMEPLLRRFAASFGPLGMLKSATLPLLSYFTGKSFTKLIRDILGPETQIEDLWLRTFCITTNIRRMESNSHFHGSLWLYVRSSMTVLGLFPPMIVDGDVLVDGGYTNNLPVDIMSRFCSTIIAVDVEDRDNSEFHGIWDYGDGVSGWWILLMKLTGWRKVPDFSSILLWLSCMSNSRQLKKSEELELIDVYIRPAIEGYNLADYHRMDSIVRKGFAIFSYRTIL